MQRRIDPLADRSHQVIDLPKPHTQHNGEEPQVRWNTLLPNRSGMPRSMVNGQVEVGVRSCGRAVVWVCGRRRGEEAEIKARYKKVRISRTAGACEWPMAESQYRT